jgi:hypothetical protein
LIEQQQHGEVLQVDLVLLLLLLLFYCCNWCMKTSV